MNPSSTRVLIVDDDRDISSLLFITRPVSKYNLYP